MPAEFQRAVDLTLTNCINTYAYLDDILIVTEGTIETHRQKLQTMLTKLDEENLAISLDKCKFACKQIEWLVSTSAVKEPNHLQRKLKRLNNYHLPKLSNNLIVSWAQYTTLQDTYQIYTNRGSPMVSTKNTKKNRHLNWLP